MTKERYYELLEQAVSRFVGTAKDLEENAETQDDIQHWNDEFMLELYEVTKDSRRV